MRLEYAVGNHFLFYLLPTQIQIQSQTSYLNLDLQTQSSFDAITIYRFVISLHFVSLLKNTKNKCLDSQSHDLG